jgi:hypothetical protein
MDEIIFCRRYRRRRSSKHAGGGGERCGWKRW